MDFKEYRYTELNNFKKYDSWIGPRIKNIPVKSFNLIPKFWKNLKLEETNLYGGKNVKFKGGIFHENEMLLFFDLGMIYYQYEFEESKSLFFGTKLNVKPKEGFIMRYDFKIKNLYENNLISEWWYCGGMDYHPTKNYNGYKYYRVSEWTKDGFITIKSKDIHECLQEIKKDIITIKKKKENVKKTKENKRIKILEKKKSSILNKFDKDNNGIIDTIEDKNEFNQLLKKHQKIVIEKGKEFNQNYTHQFIKVGNYIKQKRSNLQLIFDCIKKVPNQKELNEYVKILDVEIHSYNLLLINSLILVISLIENDQITFYDIYERFDKLNIFNSNWENEVNNKLSELNRGIDELNQNLKGVMYEIRDMSDRIVNSIDDLSYITEESTRMLDNRLGEIDSTLKFGNLISTINTYQNYKINKNTKSLRG
tara:strand:- start:816 stop:2084 length:1269 start_codon:yes stop_codon:yes gene_type:complete